MESGTLFCDVCEAYVLRSEHARHRRRHQRLFEGIRIGGRTVGSVIARDGMLRVARVGPTSGKRAKSLVMDLLGLAADEVRWAGPPHRSLRAFIAFGGFGDVYAVGLVLARANLETPNRGHVEYVWVVPGWRRCHVASVSVASASASLDTDPASPIWAMPATVTGAALVVGYRPDACYRPRPGLAPLPPELGGPPC